MKDSLTGDVQRTTAESSEATSRRGASGARAEMVAGSARMRRQRDSVEALFSGTRQRSAVSGAPLNRTGLPDALKAGVEHLSGFSLDAVKVHYNSPEPAQLQAHAFAQGMNIHVGPGQERHLAHEAWHVVQQMQGRVRPTTQMKGVDVNGDEVLEREADRMGQQALAAGMAAAPDAPVDSAPVPRAPRATFAVAASGPAQLKMGVEWETGLTAVRAWNGDLATPPHGQADTPPQWNKATYTRTIEDYRYGQDARIWTSGQGWVIDSDNSKLEFVTEPAVNVQAILGVLTAMQTGARLLPIANLEPKLLSSTGMTGAGVDEPVLMQYDGRNTFMAQVTGKPQLTVGIKFGRLYEFARFLQDYSLNSSEHLHELHAGRLDVLSHSAPEPEKGQGDQSASSSSKAGKTVEEYRAAVATEAKAQKSVMNDTKREAMGQLIAMIDAYVDTTADEDAPRSAQFEHVKGLVLMNLHYAQIAMKQARDVSYKKISFPLLMRSSFSSLYAVLEEQARAEYKAALVNLLAQLKLDKHTVLFNKAPSGEMTLGAWVKSIMEPQSRQIAKVPEYELGMDAEQHAATVDASFVKADLMTAPGAFDANGRPVGSATDKSMGRFDVLEEDGDQDSLVVIELRDIAQFFEKDLGSYTPDVLTSFHRDLMDFANGGFIKDE